MKALVQANKHSTVRELAIALKVSVGSVHDYLKSLGFIKKLDVWVPHELKEIHLTNRMSVCDQLIKHEENDLERETSLKRMIKDDEKWIVYNNVSRKRSWSRRDEAPERQAKAEIHQKKVMLSMWWNCKGPVFYDLLPKNRTINFDVYCEQLQKLNDAIAQKCPELINRKGVIFHHDNARPHTSLVTRQKLLQYGWDVLPHPPYSPDLAPSDFHLFRSLNGKTFASEDLIKQHLDKFLAKKDGKFYERSIMKLPGRGRRSNKIYH